MSEPGFLIAGSIICGSLLMMVKMIAGGFSRRDAKSGLTSIQEQCDQNSAVLEEMQSNLANHSAHLAELQERLDFAERLLTQARQREALGPGERDG